MASVKDGRIHWVHLMRQAASPMHGSGFKAVRPERLTERLLRVTALKPVRPHAAAVEQPGRTLLVGEGSCLAYTDWPAWLNWPGLIVKITMLLQLLIVQRLSAQPRETLVLTAQTF